MPVLTLTYNLPEEQQAALQAVNVNKLASAIHQFNQELRYMIKNSDDDQVISQAEWTREQLFKFLDGDLQELFEL